MAEAESGNEQLRRFAAELHRELDQLAFPENPLRLVQLTELLGLSRSQVYRINSGDAFPTLASLVKLRQLGVSLDAMLDAVAGGPSASGNRLPGSLMLWSHSVPCQFEPGRSTDLNAPLTAVPQADGHWHIRPTGECSATDLRAGATPVRSVVFASERARIAVLDDDPLTLDVLKRAFDPHFDVDCYSRATDLLAALPDSAYHAYLLDWRLPDMTGASLVRAVRQASAAPIMLLTGETGSREVADAIERADVLYSQKPVDPVILISSLGNAIRKYRAVQS